MEQYIKKSALLAEIERRFLEDYNTDDVEMDEVAQGVLASLKYFIDTLEVKEVDLEKEIEKEWLNCDLCRENTILEYANMDIKKFRTIAKYFFELGLKTKGE